MFHSAWKYLIAALGGFLGHVLRRAEVPIVGPRTSPNPRYLLSDFIGPATKDRQSQRSCRLAAGCAEKPHGISSRPKCDSLEPPPPLHWRWPSLIGPSHVGSFARHWNIHSAALCHLRADNQIAQQNCRLHFLLSLLSLGTASPIGPAFFKG